MRKYTPYSGYSNPCCCRRWNNWVLMFLFQGGSHAGGWKLSFIWGRCISSRWCNNKLRTQVPRYVITTLSIFSYEYKLCYCNIFRLLSTPMMCNVCVMGGPWTSCNTRQAPMHYPFPCCFKILITLYDALGDRSYVLNNWCIPFLGKLITIPCYLIYSNKFSDA